MHSIWLYSTATAFAGLAAYGTWGRYSASGSFDALGAAASNPDYILTNSSSRLMRHFTGIRPVDELFRILILTFWPAVDGSSATASIFCIEFAAQIFPVSVALLADNYRAANAGRWHLNHHVWQILAQAVAMANSHPWFVMLYALTSPILAKAPNLQMARDQNIVKNPATLLAIPLSYLVGHLGLCVAMSWRDISDEARQIWITLWQIFPVFVAVAQLVCTPLLSGPIIESLLGKENDVRKRHLRAVRLSYGFSIFLASAVHIGVVAVSFCTVLFPEIFAPSYATALTPARIFLLRTDSYTTIPESWTEGLIDFLQYDQFCAFGVVLVWAVAAYARAAEAKGQLVAWTNLIFWIVLGYILLGPGSIVLAVQWLKEELVFEDSEKVSKA